MNGLALELLSDYKKANKRQFIIIIVILIMWFLTIGYLVYVLKENYENNMTRSRQVRLLFLCFNLCRKEFK